MHVGLSFVRHSGEQVMVVNQYAVGSRRALRASMYSIPLGVLASASGYFTNWIIGRVSPELLGAYTGIITIAGVVVSVFVLGGTNVLVHFSAGLDDSGTRRFTSRYAFLCLLGATLGVSVVLLARGAGITLPSAVGNVPALPLIAAVAGLTFSNIATGALLSQMRLVTVSIMGCGLSVMVLLSCGLLKLAGVLSVASVFWLVGGVYLGAGMVWWVVSRAPWPSIVTSLRREWPDGFWQYVLPLHASTVVVFFAGTFDVFVVGSAGFAALGVYRVVVLARTLACWLPNIVHPPFYPVLRKAVAANDRESAGALVRLYGRLDAVSALFPAVVLIGFARLFVGTFGRGYSAAIPGVVLAIAFSGVFYPITLLGGTVLVAEGMMWQSLVINCSSLVVGWTLGALLFKGAGLVGVSLAVGVTAAVAGGMQLIVLRGVGWQLPLKWSFVSLVSLAVAGLVAVRLQNQLTGALIALTVTTGLAFATGMLTLSDLQRILHEIAARRGQKHGS